MVVIPLYFNMGEGFLKECEVTYIYHSFVPLKKYRPSPSIVSEGDFLTLFISRGYRNAKLLLSCDCGLK